MESKLTGELVRMWTHWIVAPGSATLITAA